MAYVQRMTPYRRGLEAGREYHAAFSEYSRRARESRDFSGRPVAPLCPYIVSRSVRAWQDGFRREATKLVAR